MLLGSFSLVFSTHPLRSSTVPLVHYCQHTAVPALRIQVFQTYSQIFMTYPLLESVGTPNVIKLHLTFHFFPFSVCVCVCGAPGTHTKIFLKKMKYWGWSDGSVCNVLKDLNSKPQHPSEKPAR